MGLHFRHVSLDKCSAIWNYRKIDVILNFKKTWDIWVDDGLTKPMGFPTKKDATEHVQKIVAKLEQQNAVTMPERVAPNHRSTFRIGDKLQ